MITAVFDNDTRKWRPATAEDIANFKEPDAEEIARREADYRAERLRDVRNYLKGQTLRRERARISAEAKQSWAWLDSIASPEHIAAEKAEVAAQPVEPPSPVFLQKKAAFEAEHGTLDDSKVNLWREWQKKRTAALAERDAFERRARLVRMAAATTDEQLASSEARELADLAGWEETYGDLFPILSVDSSESKMPMPVVAPIGGIPLLANQTVAVELGKPIVDGFLVGQQGQPAPAAPALPEAMNGHPLTQPLNAAIGHMVGLAERAPHAFRVGDAVNVLGVLSVVHEETCKQVVARIRAAGCALPDGKLLTAARAFEISISREVRSGAGYRTNAKGDPDPQNADNLSVFLRLAGAETRFNVWRQRTEVRPTDGDWVPFTDAELNRLRGIASQEEHRFRPTKEFFRDMLADHARQTSYNPVLDWIDGQVWDGRPRLATWLTRTCRVPCDLYHQAIGKNVIGGIVKRVRRPGAKHDEVMILIGAQGCGKSELTKVLALTREWHTDSVAFEGRPQDIVPQLFGKLVIELSELDGVHRRDVGYIKRFLSTQTDSFTAKYEAYATDHARRCIFVGTCNLENPLVDDTGNRRFYPVRVPNGVQIDIDWLRNNIGQLVAEAAHLEAAGHAFEIPREVWAEAAAIQERARTVSAVEELLLQWFSRQSPPGATGLYVLSSDIVAALTMARQNSNAKIGRIMELLGFVHARPYVNGTQVRAWIKSTTGEIGGCAHLAPVQGPNGGPVEMRLMREGP